MLASRFRTKGKRHGIRHDARVPTSGIFTLGRWGLPINFAAVVWGVLVVVNIGWPRQEIYGTIWYRRYGALIATAALLAVGGVFYRLVRRSKSGVLEAHRAPDSPLDSKSLHEPHPTLGQRPID